MPAVFTRSTVTDMALHTLAPRVNITCLGCTHGFLTPRMPMMSSGLVYSALSGSSPSVCAFHLGCIGCRISPFALTQIHAYPDAATLVLQWRRMEGKSSSVASCLSPLNVDTSVSVSDLPPSYISFLSTPSAEASSRRVREETVRFLGASLDAVDSPRKRKSSCSDGAGGHRILGEDSPKPAKRRKLDKIGRAVDSAIGAGVPDHCCRRECFRLFSTEELLARKAVRAARKWSDADSDLQAEVVRCRDPRQGERQTPVPNEPGKRTRQNYVWVVKGHTVCANMFALWHGVCKDTLYRKSAKTKGLTGVVPTVVHHGNFRRPRYGKGRKDCAAWLGQLFGRLAEPFPQHMARSRQSGEVRTREFLPTGLFATLQSVYDYYVTSAAARQPPSTPVSFVTFRRAWLQQFFQVSSAGSNNWRFVSRCGVACLRVGWCLSCGATALGVGPAAHRLPPDTGATDCRRCACTRPSPLPLATPAAG